MQALEPDDGENYARRADDAHAEFRREEQEAEETAEVGKQALMADYVSVDQKTEELLSEGAERVLGATPEQRQAVDAAAPSEPKKAPEALRYKVMLVAERMRSVNMALQLLQHQVNQQVTLSNQHSAEMQELRMQILNEYGFDLATHYIDEQGNFVPNPQQPQQAF